MELLKTWIWKPKPLDVGSLCLPTVGSLLTRDGVLIQLDCDGCISVNALEFSIPGKESTRHLASHKLAVSKYTLSTCNMLSVDTATSYTATIYTAVCT